MANGKPLLREKDKPKKERKKTTSQLKKILDKLFSEMIRRKHADSNGNVACYTCGKVKHWKEMQCGHFISRSYLATRFLEANTRVQCVGCNVFGGGKTVEFARKLELEDEGIVDYLYQEAQKTVPSFPYLQVIELVKEKLKNLKIYVYNNKKTQQNNSRRKRPFQTYAR